MHTSSSLALSPFLEAGGERQRFRFYQLYTRQSTDSYVSEWRSLCDRSINPHTHTHTHLSKTSAKLNTTLDKTPSPTPHHQQQKKKKGRGGNVFYMYSFKHHTLLETYITIPLGYLLLPKVHSLPSDPTRFDPHPHPHPHPHRFALPCPALPCAVLPLSCLLPK